MVHMSLRTMYKAEQDWSRHIRTIASTGSKSERYYLLPSPSTILTFHATRRTIAIITLSVWAVIWKGLGNSELLELSLLIRFLLQLLSGLLIRRGCPAASLRKAVGLIGVIHLCSAQL